MNAFLKASITDRLSNVFSLIIIIILIVRIFVQPDSLADTISLIVGSIALFLAIGRTVYLIRKSRKNKEEEGAELEISRKHDLLGNINMVLWVMWLVLALFTLGKSPKPTWVIVFIAIMAVSVVAVTVWYFFQKSRNKAKQGTTTD